MSNSTTPNNPWMNDWKEQIVNLLRSLKKRITYTRLELLLTLGAIILSFFSLRSSNKALSITQEQFEISNQPLLQVEMDMESVNYFNDWPVELKYRIKNLGKYPIKLIETRSKIFFEVPYTIKAVDETCPKDNRNVYITDESKTFTINLKDETPENQKSKFYGDVTEHRLISLRIYVEYINLINNKKGIYDCVIGVLGRDAFFLQNENKDMYTHFK